MALLNIYLKEYEQYRLIALYGKIIITCKHI